MQDFSLVNKNVDEVKFAQHIKEFINFFDRQSVFCDVISGLKEKRAFEKQKEKVYWIDRDNFAFAIKEVDSFVKKYLHNVKSSTERKLLEQDVENLEREFVEDNLYSKYASAKNPLNKEQEVEFTMMYLKYLMKCFEIGNKLCYELQNSLMIGTRDVKKYVQYYNDRQFFDNLSKYRDELSDDLANFKLSNSVDHLKKILGFYYTYRILIVKNDMEFLDEVKDLLIKYVVNPELINLVTKIKVASVLSGNDIETIKKETFRIKKVMSKIFYITNKSLSEKNILPKIQKKITIDKTLI